MRWSWKIADIQGIAVYIHATFWLLILFVLYSSWSQGAHARQSCRRRFVHFVRFRVRGSA